MQVFYFYLIGGIFQLSEIMIYDILQCINNMAKTESEFKLNFRGRNLLGPENQSRNICLDTRTGKITYFDYILNAEVYINNLDIHNIPSNIIKAPRVSEAFLDITYKPIIIPRAH